MYYGNRRAVATDWQLDEDTKKYRKVTKTSIRDAAEWIAVPVPDAGIPRALIDAARAAIKDNKQTSKAGHRGFWELSGGIARRTVGGHRYYTPEDIERLRRLGVGERKRRLEGGDG